MASVEEKRRKARNAAERERRRLVRLHAYEERARSAGYRLIGGIDEVGRGPLAGPVVAACVVVDGPLKLKGLNDSKQVLPEDRLVLAEQIKERVVAWAVGEASVAEIDRLNIYWASILAMERALAALAVAPEYLLTDAVRITSWSAPQEPVIKGDAKCATVAAASIIAKVHRDALLVALHDTYPHYGFAEHKGYATPQHIAALAQHGPCAEHRRAFWRVRAAMELLSGDGGAVNARAALGRAGEDAAVALLEEHGYRIVARNVRLPGGEIDVIARDGDTIVFVEVKARAGTSFGGAVRAVDARKRATLRALAADWLQIAAPRAHARFDVVTIDRGRATLHRGAFS